MSALLTVTLWKESMTYLMNFNKVTLLIEIEA